MKIVITGASGLIGRRLMKGLGQAGHSLHALSRHAGTNLPAGVQLSVWDPMKGAAPEDALRDADAVINLAGEPVAQRWTAQVKQRIRESRVTGTRHLVEGIAKLARKPAVLINSSAVGFYGSRGDAPLDESSPKGDGFLADLCVEWEREAFAAEALGVRFAAIRIGVALDAQGGALKKMLPPFRLGLGGRIGNGRQWMPWIHIDDLTGIFVFVLENAVSGALNGTAPNPATNGEFARALGKALGRPAVLPVPKFGLKLLFGEMAEMLFDSERVLPKRAESLGYRFRYPELDGALRQLLPGR